MISAGRLSGAAIFFFSFAATEVCSAAEMTFSDKYSVQLPAGWTGEKKPDGSVIGQSPADVGFGFKAYPSDIPPDEYMEKAIENTAKRPGYKLLEKGPAKSSANHKAHILRYQLDDPKGPRLYAKYYFQLAEKEVVVLLFSWPTGLAKSPKSDIETIFDSVKLATNSAQEETWGAAPAEKQKPSPKFGGGEDSKLAGRYVNGSDYIELKGDGTFSFQITGESGAGTYTRKGTTVTLKFSDSDSDDAKLEKDALVDNGGKRWVRKP